MDKKTKPLISVIIPHYRNLKFISQAISSVLRQKGVNQSQIEIIVSDEDKDKKHKNVITSLAPNIIYTTNQHQEGPGGNRQTGLSLAKGKYIIFLDSDDQLEPKFIKHSLAALNLSPAVATVCLSKSFFEPGFSLIDKFRLTPLIAIRDLSLLAGVFLNHGFVYPSAFYLCQLSHMMYRSEIFKNFMFNYDYRRGGEDWDLIVNTLNQGKIKIIPEKLLKFRYSSKSSTSSNKNRQLKWQSYSLLASRLPAKNKQGLFYLLFLLYIRLFRSGK